MRGGDWRAVHVIGDGRMDDLVAMALRYPSCGGNPVELTSTNLRDLSKR